MFSGKMFLPKSRNPSRILTLDVVLDEEVRLSVSACLARGEPGWIATTSRTPMRALSSEVAMK